MEEEKPEPVKKKVIRKIYNRIRRHKKWAMKNKKSEMSYFNQNDIVYAYWNQFKCASLSGKFETQIVETRQIKIHKKLKPW